MERLLKCLKKERSDMIKTENHCVDCGMHCLGDACRHRNVKVCYCDKCEDEINIDDVYCYDGMDVCENCLKDMCKKEW